MSLNFGTIKKREICTENASNNITHESIVRMNIKTLSNSINEECNKELNNYHRSRSITPLIERHCDNFLKSISDGQNSGRYLDEAIIFVDEFNKIDESFSNKYINNITSQIIPNASTNDLSRALYRLNDRYYGNITESQSTALENAIRDNMVASRILENHNKISKRFNIENEITQVRSKGLERTVESVCGIINTYKIEPYQKLNICIEEMSYVLDKYGIQYDKKDLVKEAVEDIVLTNELDLHELRGYKKTLESSYILEFGDLDNVKYITTDSDIATGNSINNYLDKYMLNPDKNYVTLLALCLKIAKECSILDIAMNINKLIFFVRKCCVMGIIDCEAVETIIKTMTDSICERPEIDEQYMGQIIKNIRTTLEDPRFSAPYIVKADQDCNDCQKATYIDYSIPEMNATRDLYYDNANLESIRFFGNNDPEEVSLNEFKIFKFNNLIKAAFNLDKYLKLKSRQFMKKPKAKIARFVAKARNVLFGENASINIGACVNEDNIPDICVAIYEFKDEASAELKEFLSEVCKTYNDTLLIEGLNDIKSYYIINTNTAEIHLRENVQIVCTEGEYFDKEVSFEESYYINKFVDIMELMEDASMNHLTDIQDFITEFCANKNVGEEEFEIALEAMSILNCSKADVKAFKSNYEHSHKSLLSESVSHDISKYTAVDQDLVTEADKLEAFNTLAALLEVAPEMKKPEVGPGTAASYWDDDDDDDDEEEDDSSNDSDQQSAPSPEPSTNTNDKKEFAAATKKKFGVDLNGLKLAMMGMKKRMGEMSQKERELSNDMDNNARRLVKGMKDALISDRREAIIKGSVIPSFSKCLKIAIGLAGVAKFIDPAVAIIAAIGGFAMSKHLTHKERILLLDDIEVELDVVEKEIGLAESRNQINKYRALQKYKKDLQRQYQRIKYNVRVGKDILPGSTVGLKNTD